VILFFQTSTGVPEDGVSIAAALWFQSTGRLRFDFTV
jgi:hypothetical protein